jgi:hypothetical protein
MTVAHPKESTRSNAVGQQFTQSVADRRRAARARLRREVIDAIGAEEHASTEALLQLLKSELRTIDTKTRSGQHAAARNGARRVLSELVRRYQINVDS